MFCLPFLDWRELFEGGAVRLLEGGDHINDVFSFVWLCCMMSCSLRAAMAV